MVKKLTRENILSRLPTHITIDFDTYVISDKKCRFIDSEFGEWWSTPENVLSGRGHPRRGRRSAAKSMTHTYAECLAKLPPHITIDISTFTKTHQRARFVDSEYGEFWALPCNVFTGSNHPKRGAANRKATNLVKYGFSNPMQRPEIATKSAKNSNKSVTLRHWKTNEEIVCQASWEIRVVSWLNDLSVDYDWQIPFRMPDGRLYICDLYLKNLDLYVEIKGWMRKDAQEKWIWFRAGHPNSDLWDRVKLKQLGIPIR